MATINSNTQLRGISSLFSRRVFAGILRNDMSLLRQLVSMYLPQNVSQKPLYQIFKKSYSVLSNEYRCEYLYKNELLNQKLIKEFGTDKTIAINEFKVGCSIADLAMFNGESKAFEIKSDLDSPFRLSGQMFDYTRLFQKCYIVVPENHLNEYLDEIGNGIGVIVMTHEKRHLLLEKYRDAEPNSQIDSDLAISCLHTKEYMHLIRSYFGELPNVSIFEMYEECRKLMKEIPSTTLQGLFLKEVESRKTATSILTKIQKELRQICLCMNLNSKEIDTINYNLSTTLN